MEKCEHNWLYVYSNRGFDFNGNYVHTALVCADCGIIQVSGSVNFVPFKFEFTLHTDELIKAAGQQLPFIDLPEDKPLETFICYGCAKETLEVAGKHIIPIDTNPDKLIVRLYCKKCWSEFAGNIGNTFRKLKSKLDENS